MVLISAIILAAGRSARMGRPKQLLPFAGKTVIEQVVDTVLVCGLAQTIVVLAHHAEEIKTLLDSRPVEIVVNPHPEQEMLSSLRCGLNLVRPESQAIFVALGDQPEISAESVRQVVEAFEVGRGNIVVPTNEGKRGHPILIDLRYWQEIGELSDEIGLRELLWRHPEAVREVAIEDAASIRDLDTPADYARLTDESEAAHNRE